MSERFVACRTDRVIQEGDADEQKVVRQAFADASSIARNTALTRTTLCSASNPRPGERCSVQKSDMEIIPTEGDTGRPVDHVDRDALPSPERNKSIYKRGADNIMSSVLILVILVPVAFLLDRPIGYLLPKTRQSIDLVIWPIRNQYISLIN